MTFSSNLEILNIQNLLGDSERGTDGRTKSAAYCPQGFRAIRTSLRSASANAVQLSNWGQGTSASIYGWESICLHQSHLHSFHANPDKPSR